MMFDCDCTIINQTYVNKKPVYYTTVLKGVFWDDIKAVNVVKSGLSTADSAIIVIPFSVDSGEKEYKLPKQYENIKPEHIEDFWTLETGNKIVKGIVTEKFESITELEEKFDSVLTVTSVDAKDFGSKHMQHWEVGAK